MRILKALHSATAPGDMTSAELEKQRRSQELLGQLAAPMSGLSWEEFSLSGMKAAWMRLERPHRHARCVLYCHGGGYTSGNLGYSRVLASKLVRSTGLDTLSFEYRLAPEHPYPAALEDAFRYGKIALCAPSYNAGVMPCMEDFLNHLKGKAWQKRTVALVENGSWAPTAARTMASLLDNMKDITIAGTATIRGALKESDLPALDALAEKLL